MIICDFQVKVLSWDAKEENATCMVILSQMKCGLQVILADNWQTRNTGLL